MYLLTLFSGLVSALLSALPQAAMRWRSLVCILYTIFSPNRVVSEGTELKIPDDVCSWQLMC